ncbi:cell division protein SepF [Alkalicoccus urumqiensis]|uniref:Cell division protein SepF n=1 Tax=Alkalicoccus urumqiensis TaxID=1548213 RepID=A0A2P6MG86_ALKUR|nr:cell division protein SepF [Alkalicoccus urumqiensis]PRO65309.1 cell division protein SepF [Alkalicoccus urumqiensis]
MTIKTKLKRFFDMEEEYEEREVAVEEEAGEQEFSPALSKKKKDKPNVVSLSAVSQGQSSKVILLEPHSYDEVQEIADHLKDRKAVVINLQRIPKEQAKRIVDFLSGTVYAISGDIQKLGEHIFLCTPDNVDVSGSISEMLQE